MSQRLSVEPLGLNLRSRPVVRADTRIAVLPRGHVVRLLGEARDGWVEVETELDGSEVRGFVARRYLGALSERPSSSKGIGPVHLKEEVRSAARNRDGGRAYPIGESNRPVRRKSGSASEKVGDLTRIVEWLDVENSPRYVRNGNTTYCNIYACDYCYLAGVYLPRVWWSEGAIARLARGESVRPSYGKTVFELTANRLLVWLLDSGADHGWRRTFDLGDLQESANRGEVGVVVARRKDPHRSGHIALVVPETGGEEALRHGGSVTTPLQSQAGLTNRRYSLMHWWTHQRYAQFGFWVHA